MKYYRVKYTELFSEKGAAEKIARDLNLLVRNSEREYPFNFAVTVEKIKTPFYKFEIPFARLLYGNNDYPFDIKGGIKFFRETNKIELLDVCAIDETHITSYSVVVCVPENDTHMALKKARQVISEKLGEIDNEKVQE